MIPGGRLGAGDEDSRGYFASDGKENHLVTGGGDHRHFGPQPAVHLPGTDAQQLLLDRRRHPPALAYPRQPKGQEPLQAQRPGVTGRPPDRRLHGQGLRPVPAGASASGGRAISVGRRAVEQPAGVFAVIPRIQTKLV